MGCAAARRLDATSWPRSFLGSTPYDHRATDAQAGKCNPTKQRQRDSLPLTLPTAEVHSLMKQRSHGPCPLSPPLPRISSMPSFVSML